MENTSTKSKVALVTGANAGVGFALCQRILQKFPDMKLCLCCRRKESAETAAATLREANPKSEISVVVLDTSSIKSVYQAGTEIRNKFDHIDYLYLNAGTFKVVGIDWSYFAKNFFSSKMPQMLTKGENVLLHEDDDTEDGLKTVFETNVFGHYVLLGELRSLLERALEVSQHPAQIIWTSSRNGVKNNFYPDDIQHKNGKEPYSSSKYAINMVSVGLNERMNSKNVYSHTVCPGLMNTKLVQSIVPHLFWVILMPIMFLLRLFVSSLTVTPENGCSSMFWLCEQDPASLSPNSMFHSSLDCWGKQYVNKEKMDISTQDAESLLQQLDALKDKFKETYLKTTR